MKTPLLMLSLLMVLGARPVLGAQPETWTVDPVHSTAQFTARHFGIVPVIGTIPIEKASVQLDAGSQIPIAVSAELDASKLDTHNDMRDGDLRSAHYFNVASTPDIRFVSTKIDGVDPAHFTIAGTLTMHGETHPVVLNAQVIASGKSPRGRSIIAYGASVTIDRTQWGMTYGPLVVGNSVDISLNIEADGPS
ncbi:MAG TPA: YceI family protein [Candidatus Acidoferrum sp.]|jgi:polyisoprenoid-binding protein YceI|nr:YceI family protein [Candidatus Acidoferrum sp.]